MQLCRVEHFLNTSLTFFSSKLDSPVIKTLERIRFSSDQNIGEGESNFDEKNVEEVFKKCSTRQSCIFPNFTSFKIGALGLNDSKKSKMQILSQCLSKHFCTCKFHV